MKNDTITTSEVDAKSARTDFNGFLNRAVKSGTMDVQHVRVQTRQPATEVFARKAAVAIKRLAPKTGVSTTVVELKSGAVSGPAALAEAAALFLDARPALVCYLGQPTPGAKAPAIDDGMSESDLFGILHSYSRYEVSKRFSAAPIFGSGAVAVVGGLTDFGSKVPASVMEAADSVYAQSFADVQAVSLRAAFGGNDAGLAMMKEVMATRDSGSDFGAFSLAPLSHDTRTALEILRSQLTNGNDFSQMSRDELWDNSRWAAAEGVAAWMQGHGVGYRDATSMTTGLGALSQVIGQASNPHKPSAASKATMRSVL